MAPNPKPEKPPIFTEQFWKRPDPQPKGADSADSLYEAVGRALSQWEGVDQELANLFIEFTCEPATGEMTKHAIRRAYGSIISTAGRREAIRVAAEVYFPTWIRENETEKASLTDILNAAGWAAKLRDDIAHGVVIENITVVTTY